MGCPSSRLPTLAQRQQLVVADRARRLEDGVEQRRGVALREDQVVVVRRLGVGEVVAQIARQQHRHQVRRRHARRWDAPIPPPSCSGCYPRAIAAPVHATGRGWPALPESSDRSPDWSRSWSVYLSAIVAISDPSGPAWSYSSVVSSSSRAEPARSARSTIPGRSAASFELAITRVAPALRASACVSRSTCEPNAITGTLLRAPPRSPLASLPHAPPCSPARYPASLRVLA